VLSFQAMKTIACIALLCPILAFLILSHGRSGLASVAAAHDIAANAVIQMDDLGFSTPHENLLQDLLARRIHDQRDIVGHIALHAIPKDKPIEHRDFD